MSNGHRRSMCTDATDVSGSRNDKPGNLFYTWMVTRYQDLERGEDNGIDPYRG